MKRSAVRSLVARMSSKEPIFPKDRILTDNELSQAYNWYSMYSNKKTKEKYIKEYLSVKELPTGFLKYCGSTAASACRLLSKGYKLPQKTIDFVNSNIELAKKETSKNQSSDKEPPVVSIQEKIQEATSNFIGEIEGLFDEYIQSKYKLTFNFKAKLDSWSVKSVHASKMLEWFKIKRKEYSDILTTKDPDLIEGYSNFSRKNLKNIVSFFDQLILDLVSFLDEKKATRKPRKRKVKSAEELVSKVNYCKEDKIYGFTSIDASKIIGATQLWIFNIKTRKLGVYNAQDASGFSIKGSTLLNFDEKTSLCKTVRQPKEFITKFLALGKASLKSSFTKINSKENALTGRFNADTILLRII